MIKNISLTNYRLIETLNLDFSEKQTLIVGDNGQGKTSILEAVYFLSIGKAFRAGTWTEAIRFDEQFTNIKGEVGRFSKKPQDISVSFANQPRRRIKYKLNENQVKAFDFIGSFNSVLFSPDDIKIITGGPGNRRDFLDALIVRLDKDYAYCLHAYQKVLKQRNALLKDICSSKQDESSLDVWDEALCKYGLQIIEKRIAVIDKLNPLSAKYYQSICDKNDALHIEYLCSFGSGVDSSIFLDGLRSKRNRDIILGSTGVGPHRDDFSVFLDGNLMRDYSSQGELRTAVLSLKYSEIELLKEEKGEITLLLDDVFSELDDKRQKSLLKLSAKYQTIITSATLPKGHKKSLVYYLKNGRIES